MKSYKLVNSKEVQEKAIRLGYSVFKEEGVNSEDSFLFCDDDKDYFTGDIDAFNILSRFEEITQADFLALPEPIKEGDFVKMEENKKEYTLFGKIKRIHSQDQEKGYLDLEGAEEGFFLECHKITKLTNDQVKILGLE